MTSSDQVPLRTSRSWLVLASVRSATARPLPAPRSKAKWVLAIGDPGVEGTVQARI